MADYREISQEYAKGCLVALTTVNGGAAVALLSQAADLLAADLAASLVWPMAMWSAGTTCALIVWVVGFVSTRLVDKSEREPALAGKHIATSDRFMAAGIVLALGSIAFFVGGCVALAVSLRAT